MERGTDVVQLLEQCVSLLPVLSHLTPGLAVGQVRGRGQQGSDGLRKGGLTEPR